MNTIAESTMVLQCREKTFDVSRRTCIMGILNVTPDSFSDGGKYTTTESAHQKAIQMIEDGADIIDIGGESTRPKGLYGNGAKKISSQEEMDRVLPVIEKISSSIDTILSIDTYKSEVAQEALKAGVSMVNDISGLSFDHNIAAVVSQYNAALVIMHIQGTPETMQADPSYDDVVAEVRSFLEHSVDKAKAAGVRSIIVDPGIGFGKNLKHNLTLLKNLSLLKDLGQPILIGTSRKGFLGSLLELPVDQRIEGTAASVAVAMLNGANIIRVHDVKEMKRVAVVVDAIKNLE